MAADVIVIFAKPPIPGKTKSRLAADRGEQFAADLSAAMLTDLTAEARRVSDADLILYHAPGSELLEFGGLTTDFDRCVEQRGNDLGERLYNCFEDLIQGQGYERVIIVGSDCITHSRASLADAMAALRGAPVVIQPADDGGYVLVGMTAALHAPFQGVDWGTSSVMEQTRAILARSGCDWEEMPPSFDVDTVADLERLKAFAGTHPRPSVEELLSR